MQANLLTAELDPAGRLFDEASRRLRTGELDQDDLHGLAARVEALADDLEDEAQRLEMRAAARAVRDLPDAIAEAAVYGPLASSDVVAQVDRVVDWAWQDVHSTDQARRRAREALGRLDRLRAGSPEEDRVLRAQRADLADRLAALEARQS